MGAFGYHDVRGAEEDLLSSTDKRSDASPQTSYENVGAAETIPSPGLGKFLEIQTTEVEMTRDKLIGTVNTTVGVSFQTQGEAEGGVADLGTDVGAGGASTNCTTDNYTAYGPVTTLHKAGLDKAVDVRFKLKADTPGNLTSYCIRNRKVRGRKVTRRGQRFGAQFKGAF